MPIFNNPALGQAFENLAQMFAPPSGAEAAGWAKANAERAEAARRAEAFAYAKSPNYDRAVADRMGVLGDFYDPSQSFYAVDQGNATDRYGYDTQAATLRANNSADNARALQERQMMEAGLLARQYAEPVKLGQGETAFLPPATAAATGLSPTLAGTPDPLSADEYLGAIMRDMPVSDVQQMARDKYAPTESQVQGQERRRLSEGGMLTDQMILDAITGERSPVEAIVNGRNTYLSPGAAIRMGAEPAPSKPLVSIDNSAPADGDLRKKLDEAEGKRWSDLQASAVTSSGLQQDMELLSELIGQAPQGPIVGRLAEYFPEATTAGAAFQSIVSRAAPGLRVEGSGSTSDIEYAGMMKSLPRLRNRPEANRLIVEMMQAKAGVNIRRGAIVNAYQRGEIDAAEARQRLAEINSQSIMSPELRALISGAAAAPEAADRTGGPVTPREGDTAVNPSTGERIILQNGQWRPFT